VAAFSFKSFKSMLPFLSQAMVTTVNPPLQRLQDLSRGQIVVLSRYCVVLHFGFYDKRGLLIIPYIRLENQRWLKSNSFKAGDFNSQSPNSFTSSAYPVACSCGTKGCILLNSCHDKGIMPDDGFSFIVQEPSGIIEEVKDKSRDSNFRI
jgi:hypothetical protein